MKTDLGHTCLTLLSRVRLRADASEAPIGSAATAATVQTRVWITVI